MQVSVQNIYSECKTTHENIYRLISELKQEVEKCNNYVELCDYAYGVDKSHKFVEDLKSELWKFRETINKKVCELWLRHAIENNYKIDRSIRTDYVTATPDIGQAPNIPSAKSDPAGHKALMDHLGIDISQWPEKTEGGLSEVVKIYWPGLVNLVTKNLSAGLPAPPGIDISKLMPVYKLALRKRRDVLDPIDNQVNDVE